MIGAVAIPRARPASLRLIEQGVIAYYMMCPLQYFLRQLDSESIIRTVGMRLLMPLLLGTTLCAMLARPRRADLYVHLIALATVQAFIIGLARENDPFYLISTATRIATGFVIYWYFSTDYWDSGRLDLFLSRFSTWTTASYAVAIAALWFCREILGTGIYLGLSCQALLLPMHWFAARGRPLPTVATLLLMFLSGKRGVLLAAALGLTFQFSVSRRLRSARSLAGLAVLSLAFWPAAQYLDFDIANNPAIQKLMAVYSHAELDLNKYSSGRLAELQSAYYDFTSSDTVIAIGGGLGWAYTFYDPTSPDRDVRDYHNIHFSWMNIFVIWGAPLGIIVLGVVLLRLMTVQGPLSGPAGVARCCILSLLVYTCFVYNLFDGVLLWCLVGILVALKRLKQKTYVHAQDSGLSDARVSERPATFPNVFDGGSSRHP